MKMDEMNLPEDQLRSWRPRRPSAKLKRQLFGKPTSSSRTMWLWSSLVPATACAILTLVASGSNPVDSIFQGQLNSSALSNYNSAAYAPAGLANANQVAGVTFDCTNRGISYSSVRFVPSTTNFSN